MNSKKLAIVAVASALVVAPVAATAQDATRGSGPGVVQYALGAAFAALLIYGIYDVLIDDDDDDDARPVSP
ncbi:hypothetical protein [Allosphingosinicella sp.]|uniref:hypothetical protein n=1 Tax=Allosphingosinicella sp. TaxID=2823234 RepID=UPI002FC269A6